MWVNLPHDVAFDKDDDDNDEAFDKDEANDDDIP